MTTQLFDGGFFLQSGFLNNEDNASALFTSLAGFQGQLGKIAAYSHSLASQMSKSTVGTLYGGLYQCVKFLSTMSATPARGQICIWQDALNYVVTCDATAPTEGALAGVLINAPTKGQYGIIQVGGLASVLFRASVTSKVSGNLVLQLTTTNTADAIADATGTYITGGVLGLKNIIGTAYEAPTDGGITRVWLRNLPLNI
jgi:hypothetical protein